MCSVWQKVMVAACAAVFSNENGDACDVFWSADCVEVVSSFAGTLRDSGWHIFCSLSSCTQVAPRRGVRRALSANCGGVAHSA